MTEEFFQREKTNYKFIYALGMNFKNCIFFYPPTSHKFIVLILSPHVQTSVKEGEKKAFGAEEISTTVLVKTKVRINWIAVHWVKSTQIWSYSCLYFPAFGLNTGQNNSEYGHFLCSGSFKDTLNLLWANVFGKVMCCSTPRLWMG